MTPVQRREIKKNLIGVFTLGISGIKKNMWEATFDSASSAGDDTSFAKSTAILFIFKCMWFITFTIILMCFFFVKNLLMLIFNLIAVAFSKGKLQQA